MELSKVLALLSQEFAGRGINGALIGGYALGAFGVSRATMDLGFLVAAEDLAKLDEAMRALGYDKVFSTENVSQFVSPVKKLGEVDFLHAFRPLAVEMLRKAVPMPNLPPEVKMKVLRAEDLIGLKVQAVANDPERTHRDGADIEEILKASKVDWAALKVYFDLFEKTAWYEELRARYGA